MDITWSNEINSTKNVETWIQNWLIFMSENGSFVVTKICNGVFDTGVNNFDTFSFLIVFQAWGI